jgi:hypothetical protein
MKNSYLIAGAVLIAAAGYVYVQRGKRSEATAAATATSSSSNTSTKGPSFWDRALGAVGAAATSYSQSGSVARKASNAGVLPMDLGDLDIVDRAVV